MEDPKLLAAFIDQGSEKAFAALVNRYANLVYSAALRQVHNDTHLARDVAQLLFTDLARKAPQLRGRPILTGWLYTSTHYASMHVRRGESRRLQRESEAHHMNELSSDNFPDVWPQVRPVLDDVMAELGDDERESILLRYFEGRSYAEIGQRFLIAENTARMRVERALDRMHGLLARRGVTSTATALGAVLAGQAVAAIPAGLASELVRGALAASPAGYGLMAALAGTKSQVAALAGVAALCFGALGYQLNAARRLRSEADGLRAENVAATVVLTEDRKQLAQRSSERDAQRRFLALAADLSAGESAGTQSPTRRRLVLRTRAVTTLEYASLLRALRLPTAKRERLEDLLLQKTVNEIIALRDLSRESGPGSPAPDPASIALVKAAATADIDDQIAALLGGALPTYLEYVRTRPIRHQVEEIAAAERFSDAALRDAQIDRVVGFVAQAGVDSTQPLPDAALWPAADRRDAAEQSAVARLQALRIARRTILATNRDAAARGRVTLLPLNGMTLDEFEQTEPR